MGTGNAGTAHLGTAHLGTGQHGAGRLDAAIRLAGRLVDAWGSWGPTLSPDGSRVAFVSDRRGSPELWLQDEDGHTTRREISPDPVLSVHWSPDGEWLACAVATDGGVRSQVWVLRPNGSGLRQVAGSREQHAGLGPWTRTGHRLTVALAPTVLGEPTCCVLIDPATGAHEPLAEGQLLTVLDLSADERFLMLRDGTRGAQFCVVVDRVADVDHPLLPYPHTGSTDVGLFRRSPPGVDLPMIAYLVTDAGLPRRVLVGQTVGPDGARGPAGVLAEREDAELELLDSDAAGRLLLLVWNVAGASEVELYDTVTEERWPLPGLPGPVVSGCVLSRDGSRAVFSIEGPDRPRELWAVDTSEWVRRDEPAVAPAATGDLEEAARDSSAPQPGGNPAAASVSEIPAPAEVRTGRPFEPIVVGAVEVIPGLIAPTLEHFEAHDGLPLTGWLYRPPGQAGPGPAMISLHGGPEAQERPSFSAQHQAMLAAGIAVFAPNVRGSSGFGRAFVHADDRLGRHGAIADVRACVKFLVNSQIADPARIAVTGRSYGGYLTLAALVQYPHVFAAGVDICGMSDLLTFYRDSEPWIAAAAVSKYGDPEHDRELLHDLSPLHRADKIRAPLLVVHGELDTNVPIGEAHQIVAALQALDRPVQYLQLDGEGHEYRQAVSRRVLIENMLTFLSTLLNR